MASRVLSRARTHTDRSGDPLDGLVNLFDLAIILGVAFLLAALSAFKLTDLLGHKDVTLVRDPGTKQQTIIVKKGTQVRELHLSNQQVVGEGERIGSVYRLKDGRVVYVPGR
jgi:hypothetical protein